MEGRDRSNSALGSGSSFDHGSDLVMKIKRLHDGKQQLVETMRDLVPRILLLLMDEEELASPTNHDNEKQTVNIHREPRWFDKSPSNSHDTGTSPSSPPSASIPRKPVATPKDPYTSPTNQGSRTPSSAHEIASLRAHRNTSFAATNKPAEMGSDIESLIRLYQNMAVCLALVEGELENAQFGVWNMGFAKYVRDKEDAARSLGKKKVEEIKVYEDVLEDIDAMQEGGFAPRRPLDANDPSLYPEDLRIMEQKPALSRILPMKAEGRRPTLRTRRSQSLSSYDSKSRSPTLSSPVTPSRLHGPRPQQASVAPSSPSTQYKCINEADRSRTWRINMFVSIFRNARDLNIDIGNPPDFPGARKFDAAIGADKVMGDPRCLNRAALEAAVRVERESGAVGEHVGNKGETDVVTAAAVEDPFTSSAPVRTSVPMIRSPAQTQSQPRSQSQPQRSPSFRSRPLSRSTKTKDLTVPPLNIRNNTAKSGTTTTKKLLDTGHKPALKQPPSSTASRSPPHASVVFGHTMISPVTSVAQSSAAESAAKFAMRHRPQKSSRLRNVVIGVDDSTVDIAKDSGAISESNSDTSDRTITGPEQYYRSETWSENRSSNSSSNSSGDDIKLYMHSSLANYPPQRQRSLLKENKNQTSTSPVSPLTAAEIAQLSHNTSSEYEISPLNSPVPSRRGSHREKRTTPNPTTRNATTNHGFEFEFENTKTPNFPPHNEFEEEKFKYDMKSRISRIDPSQTFPPTFTYDPSSPEISPPPMISASSVSSRKHRTGKDGGEEGLTWHTHDSDSRSDTYRLVPVAMKAEDMPWYRRGEGREREN